MRKLGLLAAVSVLAALGVAFAACGGDDNDNGGGSTPAATTASGTTPGAGGGGGSEAINATAKDFSFSLDKDAVAKSSEVTIEFKNSGSATHTITFYTDDAYTDAVSGGDSGRVNGGGSKSFSFTAPADGDELYYRCEVHPTQMKGEVSLQ